MEANSILTEAEQHQRFQILAMLLPHFGKNIDQLLEAATSVLGHVKGLPHEMPVGTEGKV